ncbi:hypothetical protein EON64_20820, partial [archaeon]
MLPFVVVGVATQQETSLSPSPPCTCVCIQPSSCNQPRNDDVECSCVCTLDRCPRVPTFAPSSVPSESFGPSSLVPTVLQPALFYPFRKPTPSQRPSTQPTVSPSVVPSTAPSSPPSPSP